MSNVKRLNRLVEILRIMDSSRQMTVQDFQNHFGISDRTVFRDMAPISSSTKDIQFYLHHHSRHISLNTSNI